MYAQKRQLHPFLKYPMVSFCPGYRDADSMPWSFPLHFWTSNWSDLKPPGSGFPTDQNEIDAVWRAVTFGLEELLVSVSLHGASGTDVSVRVAGGDLAWKAIECVKMEELHTLFGRCYSLNFPCSLERDILSIDFTFNLTNTMRGTLSLYLHPNRDSAVFGLNNNYWTLPATWEVLNRNELVDIGMAVSLRERRFGSTPSVFHECIREAMTEHVDLHLANGTDLCMAPMFGALLSYSNRSEKVEPCSTYFDFLKANMWISDLLDYIDGLDCEQPGTSVNFLTFRKEVLLPVRDLRGLSQFNLYFESTDVTTNKERRLLDPGDLLSAVGGITGMLLGWSALDLVKVIYTTLKVL